MVDLFAGINGDEREDAGEDDNVSDDDEEDKEDKASVHKTSLAF